jgi:hypothetical protein
MDLPGRPLCPASSIRYKAVVVLTTTEFITFYILVQQYRFIHGSQVSRESVSERICGIAILVIVVCIAAMISIHQTRRNVKMDECRIPMACYTPTEGNRT